MNLLQEMIALFEGKKDINKELRKAVDDWHLAVGGHDWIAETEKYQDDYDGEAEDYAENEFGGLVHHVNLDKNRKDVIAFNVDWARAQSGPCVSLMRKILKARKLPFTVKAGPKGLVFTSIVDEALDEAVYTIRDPNIKPRGAPRDKARAFDKVNPRTGERPDRSYLKGYHGGEATGKGKYIALEFADEGEFISVIVIRDDVPLTYHQPKRDPNDEYNGINVLFFPDGKIDGDTYDLQSKRQWLKDKEKIVAVAKKALKDQDLPGQYDGLQGMSVKRGTGKLSFDTDNHEIRKRSLDSHRSDKSVK